MTKELSDKDHLVEEGGSSMAASPPTFDKTLPDSATKMAPTASLGGEIAIVSTSPINVHGQDSPAALLSDGPHEDFAGSDADSPSLSQLSNESIRPQPRTIPTGIADTTLPSNAGNLTVFSGTKRVSKKLAYLPTWQRHFSENNLPVELGILEPKCMMGKKRTDLPDVKDDNGNVVYGCNGIPLRDFRYEGLQVLPNRIPENEAPWRLVAWQMWAPDITMTDYAIRMHQDRKNHLEIERETRRLNSAMGRWRKERGGLSMQKRPSGAVAKNELFIICRLNKKPFDWTLNTAYNTIWLVDEAAGTVTQPDGMGKPLRNVFKLSDFGSPQPISPRVANIRKELSLRQKDAAARKTIWQNLQFGDQTRHMTRKSNLAERKARGESAFKKSLKDDSVPSVRPKRKRSQDNDAFNTELPEDAIDRLFLEDVPSGFGRLDFSAPMILGDPTWEEVNDFVRAALNMGYPHVLPLASDPENSVIDLSGLDDDALFNDARGLVRQVGPSSHFPAFKEVFEQYEEMTDDGYEPLDSSSILGPEDEDFDFIELERYLEPDSYNDDEADMDDDLGWGY